MFTPGAIVQWNADKHNYSTRECGRSTWSDKAGGTVKSATAQALESLFTSKWCLLPTTAELLADEVRFPTKQVRLLPFMVHGV